MDDGVFTYFDPKLHKKLLYIDKLHILDIFVFKLSVKSHLLIAEDMLAHMQLVRGISDRQITGEVGEYRLYILIFLWQSVFLDKYIFIVLYWACLSSICTTDWTHPVFRGLPAIANMSLMYLVSVTSEDFT